MIILITDRYFTRKLTGRENKLRVVQYTFKTFIYACGINVVVTSL